MNTTICIFLKTRRQSLKLSVKDVISEFSKRGIEISEKTIYSWESGYRQPGTDAFLTLCDIYGVTSLNIENLSNSQNKCEKYIETDLLRILNEALNSTGLLGENETIEDDDAKFLQSVAAIISIHFRSKRDQ